MEITLHEPLLGIATVGVAICQSVESGLPATHKEKTIAPSSLGTQTTLPKQGNTRKQRKKQPLSTPTMKASRRGLSLRRNGRPGQPPEEKEDDEKADVKGSRRASAHGRGSISRSRRETAADQQLNGRRRANKRRRAPSARIAPFLTAVGCNSCSGRGPTHAKPIP